MTYKYNSELSNYDSKLQDFIFWKRREKFALLMENLLTDSINMEEFQIGFSLLWWESMDEDATFTRDSKRVKNFQLNPKAYGFCSLVTAIFRQFEVLEDEECTEQEVKDDVRDVLQEIQPYLESQIVLNSDFLAQNLKHY
jgi:hypothetical protein